jgi:hypothetical protein
MKYCKRTSVADASDGEIAETGEEGEEVNLAHAQGEVY